RLGSRSYSMPLVTQAIEGKSSAFKNEFLFQQGINFNELPHWQKRGMALYWQTVEKQGWNPVKAQYETAQRRNLKVDMNLPMKDAYTSFLQEILINDNRLQ
ncbi:MAG: guanylyltransferase, partial [Bacteroidota bacterium]